MRLRRASPAGRSKRQRLYEHMPISSFSWSIQPGQKSIEIVQAMMVSSDIATVTLSAYLEATTSGLGLFAIIR